MAKLLADGLISKRGFIDLKHEFIGSNASSSNHQGEGDSNASSSNHQGEADSHASSSNREGEEALSDEALEVLVQRYLSIFQQEDDKSSFRRFF